MSIQLWFSLSRRNWILRNEYRKESTGDSIWNYVTLDDLIADGVVEGIPSEELQYFHVSSADSDTIEVTNVLPAKGC